MKVLNIVKDHLLENGFDGLVDPEMRCGCSFDDLMRYCDADSCKECMPAYKHGQEGSEILGDWEMWLQKEPPTPEQWEARRSM